MSHAGSETPFRGERKEEATVITAGVIEFIRRYSRKSHDPAVADEDHVQESLCRALGRDPKLVVSAASEQKVLIRELGRVAVSIRGDWNKAVRRHPSTFYYTSSNDSEVPGIDFPDDHMDDPSVGPIREEQQGLVREAVRKLIPRQRKAIVLYYFGGLDLESIARAVGVPIGTVKSDLHRGRRSLRSLLADCYLAA